MRIVTYFGSLLIISMLMVGCGSTKELTKSGTQQNKKQEASSADQSIRVKIERTFIEGQKAKVLGDNEEAIKLFNQVVKMDPENGAAKYELARLYYQSGLYSLAYDHAKASVKDEPQNKWYKMLYADLLAVDGKHKDAARVYEEIILDNPDEYELHFEWAYLLIQAEEYEEAIAVYDILEQKIGLQEDLIFQKQKLYLKLNELDKAVAEIMKLIDQNPRDPDYYGVLAELYESNDMIEDAKIWYNKILVIDENNPQALIALADIANKEGNKEMYLKNIKKIFADPNIEIDLKVAVLYPYIDQYESRKAEMQEAFDLAETMIQAHPGQAKALALQGDLFYMDDQLEKALTSYKKSLEISTDIYTVWQQVMLIESDLEMYESLIQNSNNAIELFPIQPLSYLMKGVGHQQLKQYEEALKPLSIGAKVATDNVRLKAQFYSNMGDIFHELKNHSASDSCYDYSIKLDPENAYVLNNYSYYLSLRDEKLNKAKDMAEAANRLVPDNSAFQDTYAWVLYKLGKFKDAKEWQMKAIENGGEDRPVLLEHYGDILYQLGDINGAVVYWQKAMEKGSESELLGKKIADRKLYEE